MKKWIVGLILVLGLIGITWAWAALPAGDAPVAETTPQPTDQYADLTLNFAEAYFTGTWCYISCGDGSGTTVQAFSTNNCCNACANFCSLTCVAEGGGPSVLCGGF